MAIITKDYTLQWNESGHVENNLTINFNVAGSVTSNLSIVYNVLNIGSAGNARITRADTLALVTQNGSIRTTKSALLALVSISQPVYVTKLSVLALTGPSDCLTKFCQCWRITREDGQIFAYTTHNESVNFDGTIFSPCYGVSASATESGIITQRGIGDVELVGIMHEDGITEHDIVNGLFDNALVDGFLVGWDSHTRPSSKRLIKGRIGKSKHQKNKYEFEVLTFGVKLEQNTLQNVFTPGCRFNLGESPCPVNLASFTVSGSVTNITEANGLNRTRFRQFFDSSLTQANGYFDFGKLTWLTGNNAGSSSEVKSYSSADDMVTLWNSMPYPIEIGDTYTMSPGCKKDLADHTVKFILPADSFGGFPDVPGNDAIQRTPNAP